MISTVEEYLQDFRNHNGDEAWRVEVRRLAAAALRTGSAKHEVFWRDLTKDFTWLDWDHLKQQAQPDAPGPDRMIVEALKSQMPGIQSQAQYDAVVGVLEAARLVINALLKVDVVLEGEARKALDVAFGVVRQATELTLKLEECPEAATSAAAQQFKNEPVQFHEGDIQAQLMQELMLLRSVEALNEWYRSTKERRDKVVTQTRRNELLDAIRAKRNVLGSS